MLTIPHIKGEILPLAVKYGVAKIDLFGSYANGTATEKSDVDFLVEFKVPVPSIFAVMGFKSEVESRLNHPVDVVTLPISKPDMLNIDKRITVYEYAG